MNETEEKKRRADEKEEEEKKRRRRADEEKRRREEEEEERREFEEKRRVAEKKRRAEEEEEEWDDFCFMCLSLKQARNTGPREKQEAVNYNESTWGRMLQHPRLPDKESIESKLFTRRFRVPYPVFQWESGFVWGAENGLHESDTDEHWSRPRYRDEHGVVKTIPEDLDFTKQGSFHFNQNQFVSFEDDADDIELTISQLVALQVERDSRFDDLRAKLVTHHDIVSRHGLTHWLRS